MRIDAVAQFQRGLARRGREVIAELAYRIARDELITSPVPAAVIPAAITFATSPPCAPTPGTRNGRSPTR